MTANLTPIAKTTVAKKFLLPAFLLFIAFSSKAQKGYLPEFGKADMKELLMKECEFDKNAAALKLLDYQQSDVIVAGYDVKVEIERRVRIKIFNAKGFDFANITIPYEGRKRVSKIKDIEAYVYNLDSAGNIVVRKIEKKQIYREKAEKGVNKVVFTFPDLRPGSIIEYRYTKIEKENIRFEPWFFQDVIPTLESVCRIMRPSFVPLDQRFITVDSVEKKTERKTNNYSNYSTFISTFTLRKIPAFRFEPLMSSVKDNLQRIQFAMTPTGYLPGDLPLNLSSWDYFNRRLLRSSYFGKPILTPIAGTDYIIDSVKKLVDTNDKINYIFSEVKRKIKWDEEQTFYADDINDAWSNSTASSAEENLILLNLIRRAGIRSYPLLVSTRDNGKTDEKFMTLSQFNGVDALVLDSSGTYILDATQKYQSYKTPPLNVLNREAYLIDTTISQWVYITDNRPLYKNTINALATIDKAGEIKGQAAAYYFDFAKSEKLTYKPAEKEEDEEKKFIEKEATDVKIDSVKQENADNELEALKNNFHFKGKLSNTGDFYFFDPLFLSGFRKNPFTDSLRNTDVDFGSNQYYSIYVTVNIPDSFVVDHMPPSQVLRAEDSSIMFRRVYFNQNNTLVLRHSFEVLKPIYTKEEYPVLKEFFKKMYAMINEQIVFKKQ